MELILVVEFMVVAFGSFIYVAMKPEKRSAMWRKIQCYSAARAESIDLYDRLHTQYKQQMGVN